MNTKLPNSSWIPGGILVVVLLSALCLGVVEGQGHEPGLESTGRGDLEVIPLARSFTISADPRAEVLWLKASGGMSGETSIYVLYGDGRLVRTYSWAPGQSEAREIQVDFTEAMDLMELAVEGSLMEWSSEGLEQQIVESVGRVPKWTGTRRFELRLALESYSNSPEGPGLPMTKTIVTRSVGYLRFQAPNVREIAAFDDLVKILSLYFQPQEENE